MFAWKREEKQQGRSAGGSAQARPKGAGAYPPFIGIDQVGNVDDGSDDSDLEAELLALTGAGPKPRKSAPKMIVDPMQLDAMVAASLRDVPSDDEDDDGSEDSPELLAELDFLTNDEPEATFTKQEVVSSPPSTKGPNVSLLEQRLSMYREAESFAKTAGESARARRFGRGVKTLTEMLRDAKAGKPVNEEDIPPPVSVGASKPPVQENLIDLGPSEPPADSQPTIATKTPQPPPRTSRQVPPVPTRTAPSVPSRVAPPVPGRAAPAVPPKPVVAELQTENEQPMEVVERKPTIDEETLAIITERRSQYKTAAAHAVKDKDTTLAMKYLKIVKQFEPLIVAVQEGRPVNINSLPPPPQELSVAPLPIAPTTSVVPAKSESSVTVTVPEEVNLEDMPAADPSVYNAPPAPTTVLEALEQRLEKYRNEVVKAEDNASKMRRMGRIVKQYEDAIKAHKAGRPVPFDDLPNPPGFAPIPRENASTTSVAPAPTHPVPSPSAKPKAPPQIPPSASTETQRAKLPVPQRSSVRKSPQSMQEKQLAFLIERQAMFKAAALEAKKKGEIQQAKEYLRMCKGFDPLLEAAKCGLPVDMKSLPVPPSLKVNLESDFELVSPADCNPPTELDDIYKKLEEDLLMQMKMCVQMRDHFRQLGDVASANRFEHLGMDCKRDIDAVRISEKRGSGIPKFHYETKVFSIIQCCTELNDNDLELTIIRGINYNVPNPKEVDTYVKFELPYPSQEEMQSDKTAVVKDTNNPEYNQVFVLQINRSSRALARLFKRQAIKLEVWSKGGFLRSSTLLGTASVKLLPLETKCIVHDSYDIANGRKPTGGKIEVKMRLRHPVVAKQIEQKKEKWLVIDSS